MKKREKDGEILKRAYEYARSGEHQNYVSIEHQLEAEGLSGARHVLDSPSIHEELNLLCKDATLPEEVERRQQFKAWLEATIRVATCFYEQYVRVWDMTLFIDGPTYSSEIKRRFGSRTLEVTKIFKGADGLRIPHSPKRLPDSDFLEISDDDRIIAFIKQFIE